MTCPASLSPADREFFSLIARAVFANPFGPERGEIDAQVTGCAPEQDYRERRAQVADRVFARLDALEAKGFASLGIYRGADRETLYYAFLFDAYHRFKDPFDELIVEQARLGDEPCDVGFAPEALSLLARRGFTAEESLRHFALFYQLRRAFYFIYRNLVGSSPSMRELRRDLWNNVFTSHRGWYNEFLWDRMEDFSTLLLGETGTGKGSAAAAIGRSGFIPFDEKRGRFRESFTRTFVSINLSQFAEGLIESELFGHKKGAFTGAVEDHPGVLASCVPFGSIFLDEIGEVSTPVQIKLLRVLQERTFSPVGSHERKRFHGRVIAATNRLLEELRGGGSLRDDFYYRLCSDVIVVPPLRQRVAEDPGELAMLTGHLLCRLLGEDSPRIAGPVLETIERELGPGYPWPGNVRELEQCVRRVLLKQTTRGDRLPGGRDVRARLCEAIDTESLDAAGLLEGYCALLRERHGSWESVARLTGLDRRTVKKYVGRWREREEGGESDGARSEAE